MAKRSDYKSDDMMPGDTIHTFNSIEGGNKEQRFQRSTKQFKRPVRAETTLKVSNETNQKEKR